MRHGDACSERTECGFVHVGRARAQDAAARERHFGAAEAAEQRSAEVERRGELAHQRVGCAVGVHVRGIDRDRVRPIEREARAQRFEERPHHGDVGDARDAVQRHLLVREDGRGHDRQGRVLRAVGVDRAFESGARRGSAEWCRAGRGRSRPVFAAGKLAAAVPRRLHGPIAEPEGRQRQRDL